MKPPEPIMYYHLKTIDTKARSLPGKHYIVCMISGGEKLQAKYSISYVDHRKSDENYFYRAAKNYFSAKHICV
jgi:hypothetical protein